MQTIENSLLRVAIAEDGAQMLSLVNHGNQSDYFKSDAAQEKLTVVFPSADQGENWAELLHWTVVDKGDARVSLALIDDAVSYKKFPYHFEMILTYALEGNRIDLKCYLKNNSHKEMPFSLSFVLPVITGWTVKESVNEVELTNQEATIKLNSANFALTAKGEQVVASIDNALLAGDNDNEFQLTLALS
ncbi:MULTISPECIES: aldose epimerase [unclassified Lactobacillus]|uniref:aldose epimerase family protein n=1 Tax=unclassified Lactobacillus TaxID=2620435 RepID=UPI0023F9F966|nr:MULTISPECIES: aldose epimerase [unclassified Lactobacillus]MDF7668848.1 aldose epimerase [Lactobacillus sp. ESL0703]WEV38457.1 aldose epimerase [Lactobacillus sp. ESL0680]